MTGCGRHRPQRLQPPLSKLQPEAQDRVFRGLATAIAEELSRGAFADLPKADETIPDKHIYLDRFPLSRSSGLREEKLIGREQELALLDLVFAQPRTAIVSLVAWGGVGKTMLVQHWLQRLQREGWLAARRVYAWSFFSQGTKEDRQASEDMFLAHALEWFGVQCEPTLSPWDKGRLLADAVIRERTLLILDGIEPLQYPPGPMGGQLRAPGVQSLLKQLARQANNTEHRGLCLVTTREPLTDLADFQRREGSAWGSVLRIDLGNLTDEAGAALLHHAGAKSAGAAEIKPDDTELLAASREVDGHALTLNLLGRFLARAHSGDIRRRDLVKFEEADRQEKGGTTFKMLAAFEKWLDRSSGIYQQSLAVLRMLSLFDRAADVSYLAALRKWPAIAGLTTPQFNSLIRIFGCEFGRTPIREEDWNVATSFLVDCELASIHAEASAANSAQAAIDCHPLIREYFAKQLQTHSPRAWQAANCRLYYHLATIADDHPATLAAMEPLFQALGHGCKALMHQQACDDTYRDRIKHGSDGFSLKQLGAFTSELAAVANFFEPPWSRLSPNLTERAKSFLLNESAFSLRAVGRLTESLGAIRAALDMMIHQRDWQNAPTGSSTLTELELTLGDIPEATREAGHTVQLADRSRHVVHRLNAHATLGDALHQSGDRIGAKANFLAAEALQAGDMPQYPLLFSYPGFQFCDLLLDEAEQTAWHQWLALGPASSFNSPAQVEAIRLIEEVEHRIQVSPSRTNAAFQINGPLDVAQEQLLLGRCVLYRAVLGADAAPIAAANEVTLEVEQQITIALNALRCAGQVDVLPPGLLVGAWVNALQGNSADARAHLDEAWDIANRGPMGLHMADVHLHRARLFFRERPYPWKSPQDDLAAAEKLINDCGYHRRDEELADAKHAILNR